jgi:hypothetical protein
MQPIFSVFFPSRLRGEPFALLCFLLKEIYHFLSPRSLVDLIQPKNLLFGLWRKPLLVRTHASQRTEAHSPIAMHGTPDFVAAIVTLR